MDKIYRQESAISEKQKEIEQLKIIIKKVGNENIKHTNNIANHNTVNNPNNTNNNNTSNNTPQKNSNINNNNNNNIINTSYHTFSMNNDNIVFIPQEDPNNNFHNNNNLNTNKNNYDTFSNIQSFMQTNQNENIVEESVKNGGSDSVKNGNHTHMNNNYFNINTLPNKDNGIIDKIDNKTHSRLKQHTNTPNFSQKNLMKNNSADNSLHNTNSINKIINTNTSRNENTNTLNTMSNLTNLTNDSINNNKNIEKDKKGIPINIIAPTTIQQFNGTIHILNKSFSKIVDESKKEDNIDENNLPLNTSNIINKSVLDEKQELVLKYARGKLAFDVDDFINKKLSKINSIGIRSKSVAGNESNYIGDKKSKVLEKTIRKKEYGKRLSNSSIKSTKGNLLYLIY